MRVECLFLSYSLYLYIIFWSCVLCDRFWWNWWSLLCEISWYAPWSVIYIIIIIVLGFNSICVNIMTTIYVIFTIVINILVINALIFEFNRFIVYLLFLTIEFVATAIPIHNSLFILQQIQSALTNSTISPLYISVFIFTIVHINNFLHTTLPTIIITMLLHIIITFDIFNLLR